MENIIVEIVSTLHVEREGLELLVDQDRDLGQAMAQVSAEIERECADRGLAVIHTWDEYLMGNGYIDVSGIGEPGTEEYEIEHDRVLSLATECVFQAWNSLIP